MTHYTKLNNLYISGINTLIQLLYILDKFQKKALFTKIRKSMTNLLARFVYACKRIRKQYTPLDPQNQFRINFNHPY